jgi:hypothetical protein
MPTGNHERVNMPSAVNIGVEKLVDATVTGKTHASVAALADGGRVVVRGPFRSTSWAESATTPCRSLLATYHFASGIVGRRSLTTRPAARLT